MECEEFVAMDAAYQRAMVYWVAGVDRLGVRVTDKLVVDTVQPVEDGYGGMQKNAKCDVHGEGARNVQKEEYDASQALRAHLVRH